MPRHVRGGDYDQGYRAGSAVGLLLVSAVSAVSCLAGLIAGWLL